VKEKDTARRESNTVQVEWRRSRHRGREEDKEREREEKRETNIYRKRLKQEGRERKMAGRD
jgi:hypothetical protein